MGGFALCAGLFICIVATYLIIASINYSRYGVFLMNDFSEGEFPKVVGVLKSIQEETRTADRFAHPKTVTRPDPDRSVIEQKNVASLLSDHMLLAPSETEKLLALSSKFREIKALLRKVQETEPSVDYSRSMFFLRVTALRGDHPIGVSAT
jgi:hypothetical protein